MMQTPLITSQTLDMCFAEVHGHEQRPLPDQHGCTAVSMEADLQEPRLWSRAKGLVWKSPLGSGCSEQEEDGLQTGESPALRSFAPAGFPLFTATPLDDKCQ